MRILALLVALLLVGCTPPPPQTQVLAERLVTAGVDNPQVVGDYEEEESTSKSGKKPTKKKTKTSKSQKTTTPPSKPKRLVGYQVDFVVSGCDVQVEQDLGDGHNDYRLDELKIGDDEFDFPRDALVNPTVKQIDDFLSTLEEAKPCYVRGG